MAVCPSDVLMVEQHWQQLRRHSLKLINSVSVDNMFDTVESFRRLGFPWAEPKLLDSFAGLIVSASGGHGFYAECYSKLICALNSLCEEPLSASGSGDCTHFLSAVKDALSAQFRKTVRAMSEDDQTVPETWRPALKLGESMRLQALGDKADKLKQLPAGKLRDRLVNSCNLAASLVHLGVYSADDVSQILQCLGVLNEVCLQPVDAESQTSSSALEKQAMPRVAMLSGRFPSSQPLRGETMSDWRDRLARELKFPCDRLRLLDGEAEVSLDACLDGFSDTLQVLVRRVNMKEEYRVEAATTLVSKAAPDLVATQSGQDLLRQVLAHWEQLEPDLSKRAKFMIMDAKTVIEFESDSLYGAVTQG